MSKTIENKFIIKEDYVEIIIHSPKFGDKVAKIDLEDYEKCKDIHWCVNKIYKKDRETPREVFYAKGKVEGKHILLHRYVMNAPSDMQVDHIYHDELDNRKEYLRITTKVQNGINKIRPIHNKSGHKGVCWYPHHNYNKWKSYICVDRKRINLAYSDTLEEAIKIREEAELKYFGEYRTNSTLDDYKMVD